MWWQTLTSSHPCFHRDRKPTVVNSLSSSDSTVMSWKVHLPQTSDWVSADYSTDMRWRTNLVPTDEITVTSWQLYFPTDVRIEHAMIDSHVLETLGFHRRQNRLYQYSYALANPLGSEGHIINTNTNVSAFPLVHLIRHLVWSSIIIPSHRAVVLLSS